MEYPHSIRRLIQKFAKLPTLGPKTSERIVLHLLNVPDPELDDFSLALKEIKKDITVCRECGNFSDSALCELCRNPNRFKNVICVVSKPQDILALEKTKVYTGVYHILGGTVNPLEGIKLEQLRIQELLKRINVNGVRELILAFNPDIEGETTILAIVKLLKDHSIKITRLARGLPMGSDIEYADEITLSDAFSGRRALNENPPR